YNEIKYPLCCYKNHLKDMYKSFFVNDSKAFQDVVKAICPQKAWRRHQDGISAEVAYQHEQQSKSFKWTKRGVIIAIISAIVTLAVLGLTIYGIFFNNPLS
ncbi:MAG: hypothetical protein JXA51_07200, partial [Dehalococcoidales bacterium]|nr:hypothetical protein [Dehalococcoidales bacterium]